MTSIGVPIHCAASEPEIDAFWIAARPASNAANRRRGAAIKEDRDRIVPPKQEAVRSGLRLVERHVVQRDLHAELVAESTEEVRCLFPAEPRAPTDLQGH